MSTDLNAFLKGSDPEQVLTVKSVLAQGYGFSPKEVLKIHDTGEGYGPRLAFITESSGGAVDIGLIVLRDDLEPFQTLIPRVEGLEQSVGLAAGTLDINDPALAAFKKAVLDEVAKKMAGVSEVAPPADIDWAYIRQGMQIRLVNGWLEFKGTINISPTTSSRLLGEIPPEFPLPEFDASYPVACREAGVNVRYGYLTLSATSRNVSFSPGGGTVNELTVSGVRCKAQWS